MKKTMKTTPNGNPVNYERLCSASENTVNWARGSNAYTEIFYDRSDGDVWTVDQISLGHNSWTRYDDKNIIKICDTEKHMSTDKICEMIDYKMQMEKIYDDEFEKQWK